MKNCSRGYFFVKLKITNHDDDSFSSEFDPY